MISPLCVGRRVDRQPAAPTLTTGHRRSLLPCHGIAWQFEAALKMNCSHIYPCRTTMPVLPSLAYHPRQMNRCIRLCDDLGLVCEHLIVCTPDYTRAAIPAASMYLAHHGSQSQAPVRVNTKPATLCATAVSVRFNRLMPIVACLSKQWPSTLRCCSPPSCLPRPTPCGCHTRFAAPRRQRRRRRHRKRPGELAPSRARQDVKLQDRVMQVALPAAHPTSLTVGARASTLPVRTLY